MRILVNGLQCDVRAATLGGLLNKLGYEDQKVGTAVNQEFVRSKDRDGIKLKEDDAVEIVTPRQGG